MENRATEIKNKRRTRIRVTTTERLIVWQVPKGESSLALACPHCGADVFWLEVDQTECEVQHETYESED